MADPPKPTIVAAFSDRFEAEKAVDELEQNGFTPDHVGFVLRGSDVARGGMLSDAEGAKDKKGAVAGIAAGASIGALLGAGTAMLVPGVGPILAGGILSMVFGGAAAGAVVGGIFGALTGLGVSEEEARFYEKEFKSGRAIVAVKPNSRWSEAAEILRRHGGYNIQTRTDSPVPTKGLFSEP
jgi:hypothetical protein